MASWSVSGSAHCGPGACLIDPFRHGRHSLRACCYFSSLAYNTATAREVWRVGAGGGSSANWKVSALIGALRRVSCGASGCRSRALVHSKSPRPLLQLKSFRGRFAFVFGCFTQHSQSSARNVSFFLRFRNRRIFTSAQCRTHSYPRQRGVQVKPGLHDC